jgi:hypothetical protein
VSWAGERCAVSNCDYCRIQALRLANSVPDAPLSTLPLILDQLQRVSPTVNTAAKCARRDTALAKDAAMEAEHLVQYGELHWVSTPTSAAKRVGPPLTIARAQLSLCPS